MKPAQVVGSGYKQSVGPLHFVAEMSADGHTNSDTDRTSCGYADAVATVTARTSRLVRANIFSSNVVVFACRVGLFCFMWEGS